MRKKEIIQHVSQYKSEINRILLNQGKEYQIGFNYQDSINLYYFGSKDKNIIRTVYNANNGKDLLKAIQIIYYSQQ
jgi:hypothetical protein